MFSNYIKKSKQEMKKLIKKKDAGHGQNRSKIDISKGVHTDGFSYFSLIFSYFIF